ncbi:MAG: DUF2892 domain-containing protein [Proteobacteria bacterium]|nr:MAG: DUF2892 domain-containing protein [Pseudomonadota bacterium]
MRGIFMAPKVNVGTFERTASVVLGGLALTQAISSKKSIVARGAAGSTALALLWRGLSGNCPAYSVMGMSSSKSPLTKPQTWIERSALVNLPLEEVTAYLTSGQSPYGTFLSTGSDIFKIEMDGRMWMINLQAHADGKRTLIRMSWDDPKDSQSLLDILSDAREPAPRIIALRELKALLETGEIPTVEGQSHGERSNLGNFFENFGDFIIEKIQSQTSLPDDPHINEDFPAKHSYLKEANA